MFFIVGWIYVIPGWVAFHDDVLSQEGVSNKLTGEAKAKWAAFSRQKDEYRKRIEEIDNRVNSVDKGAADLSSLVTLRGRYELALEAKPPFAVSGMIGDWLNEIWVVSNLTLGCLVAIWFYPRVRLRFSRILGWNVILYIFSCIQVIVRNTFLTTPQVGRSAYWWVNKDISLWSYVLQDVRECGMFFLMCIFWDLGRQRLEILRGLLQDPLKSPEDASGRLRFAGGVFQRALSLWQASTILMLILFMPWSFFYWH
jgi:hypothetical protein